MRNFVKELGGKCTKWEDNVLFLAEKAKMPVEKFLETDPISYGSKVWGSFAKQKLMKLLGPSIYDGIERSNNLPPLFHIWSPSLASKPVAEPLSGSFPTDDFVPAVLTVGGDQKKNYCASVKDCSKACDCLDESIQKKPTEDIEGSLDSAWNEANTKFEDVYAKAKYGACSWNELGVAYQDMEKAAILLAEEMNKNPSRAREAVNRVTEDMKPSFVIQDSDTDEKAIEKFENFFLISTADKKYSLDEAAKEKIKLAEMIIQCIEKDAPEIHHLLGNNDIEKKKARLERAIRQFQLWRKTAQEDLNETLPSPIVNDEYDDLPELIPIAQANLEPSEWCCPTCTAVWKTR